MDQIRFKRTSLSKKRIRKNIWKRKPSTAAAGSLSKPKIQPNQNSLDRSPSFRIYPPPKWQN